MSVQIEVHQKSGNPYHVKLTEAKRLVAASQAEWLDEARTILRLTGAFRGRFAVIRRHGQITHRFPICPPTE